MNQTEKEEKTVASLFFINYYPAPSYFNDFQEKMSFKEALAILPKNTRISLDTTGSLTINGHTRDEFVAHNCPFKPIDDNGNMWVVYGIVSADEPDREDLPDSRCKGLPNYYSLIFEGTAEFENTVYAIKFDSKEYYSDHDKIFKKVKGEVTLDEYTCQKIRVYLRDEVLPLYPRDVHIRKI